MDYTVNSNVMLVCDSVCVQERHAKVVRRNKELRDELSAEEEDLQF